MTVGELLTAVACLGFENRLGDAVIRRGFYAALNRGIAELDALRPRVASIAVCHRPPRDLLPAFTPVLHRTGVTVNVPLPAGTRAFTARVSGDGNLTLHDDRGNRDFPFRSGRKTVTLGDKVEGNGILTFGDGQTDSDYDILDIRALDRRDADGDEGTGDPAGFRVYRMGDFRPDFLAFDPPVLLLCGAPYPGEYRTEGDALILPDDAPAGEYTVRFRISPPVIGEGDGENTEIPLENDLATLLPELIASSLWLDDAPEKAAVYAENYRRKYAILRSSLRRRESAALPNTNGW